LSDPSGFNLMSKEMLDRYGPLPDTVVKLLVILEIKLLCQKLHISKAKINVGEIFCDIEPTTPISREKFTAIMDSGIRLVSERRIAIRIINKGWRQDAQAFIGYLRKLQDLCDES